VPREENIIMALTINETTITPEPIAHGVTRQRLLTEKHTAQGKVLLDRVNIAAGVQQALSVAEGDLAWIQILGGEATLSHGNTAQALTQAHIVFLPPGFAGTLTAASDAALLHATVPDAARFDAAFKTNPPQLRIVDWTREPMLDSEHDARKRIYIATPKLFGTKAIKGEMIIYPPGTEASNHHHEGAEHFMYVLKGRGTAYANESPLPVKKGDLIYYGDRERHYLRSEGDTEMAFVEFFVPGEYKTIWVPGAPVCTWTPTGTSLSGAKPVREIARHTSADVVSPADV
jgi:quercetin dioxygenase-like cupin family protein